MMDFLKWLLKKIKLAFLWVRRILFAPNHFKIPFYKRLPINFQGFMADQYALYDLGKKENRKLYLSEFDWYRSRWINEPFDNMLNNKIVCAEILSHYADIPRTLVVKTKGVISFNQGDGISRKSSEVVELLKRENSLFMKPYGSGKGKGVHSLAFENNQLYLDNKISTSAEVCALLDSEDGWFLSDTIKQHQYLNDIYDKTTNTIRLITLRDPETDKYKVFFAVQRIGTSSTIPVDNASMGGLVACINLETGELSEARSLHNLDVHEVHPDSGNPIKGVVVPEWNYIKETALNLAKRFPYIVFVAWDILLGEDGKAYIIEANASSGVNIVQLWGPQKQGELGDFYRAHGVLKK